ncbi:MAG: VCBS repeat-containing protein [Acidobacteriota bacterium]
MKSGNYLPRILVLSAFAALFLTIHIGFPLERHASMQSRTAADHQPRALLPDLGIGGDLHGNRPFPANNAWNMDVSRYPVHPNSANLVASIGANTGLHPDFGTFWQNEPIGFPYDVVSGIQARVPMDFIWWADQSDPGPYPFPPDAPVEGGNASVGDRHVLVIDRDNWKLYETYSSYPQNGGASWQAGNGAVWNLGSNKLRPVDWTSADAAGLPIFPGLVRRDEVVGQGEIRHALRFTINTSRHSYVYPATHEAGSTNSVNAPPMGLRVRLKASKNISTFSPHIQVILRAMKKYGMIVADNGSNWYVSGTHDPAWDDNELGALSQIKGSDFEVVNTPSRLVMPISDFDGDGMSDLSVFRPTDGNWYTLGSGGNVSISNWGLPTDIAVPGDYDGDGKTDPAIYRPSTGTWYTLRSADGSVGIASWGNPGDKPVPGDYDGDGKVDLAIYRPGTGTWYIVRSSDNGISITTWGNSADIPVQVDLDGDGKCDPAIYRPSTGVWYALRSTGGVFIAAWGLSGDKPVPGDYDGDGKDDVAVYRPAAGNWFVLRSSDNGVSITNWGQPGDVAVPADYDGDGKDDPAVFRNGSWYALRSTGGIMIASWGSAGDQPAPANYLPN